MREFASSSCDYNLMTFTRNFRWNFRSVAQKVVEVVADHY